MTREERKIEFGKWILENKASGVSYLTIFNFIYDLAAEEIDLLKQENEKLKEEYVEDQSEMEYLKDKLKDGGD